MNKWPIIAAVTVASCSPAPGHVPTPSPTALNETVGSAAPSPPLKLTGGWAGGITSSTDTRLLSPCRPMLLWQLVQTGDQITGRIASQADFPDPAYRFEEIVAGKIEGTQVRLSGTRVQGGRPQAVRYDLALDGAFERLQGKRDGEEFSVYRTTPAPCENVRPTLDGGWTTGSAIGGKVYDDSGQLLTEGAKLYIQSLSPSFPFTMTTPVENGAYVAPVVPQGVQLVWSIAKPGWTTRTRIETLLPFGAGQPDIDFGGPSPSDNARWYFISNKPEITAVFNQAAFDDRQFSFTLLLSETLDPANRERLAKAVTVVPVNAAALMPRRDGGPLDVLASAPPTLRELNHYLSARTEPGPDSDQRYPLTCRWNQEGRELTVTGTMPYDVNDWANARYDVALFSPDDAPIVDGDNHRLGTDAAGSFDALPLKNALIFGTFYRGQPGPLTSLDSTSKETRWRDTHRASMRVR